jgi:hypothetical protein
MRDMKINDNQLHYEPSHHKTAENHKILRTIKNAYYTSLYIYTTFGSSELYYSANVH